MGTPTESRRALFDAGMYPKDYFCLAHIFYFSPANLAYIVNQAGLKIVNHDIGRGAVRYMVRPSDTSAPEDLYKSLRFEKIKTSAYLGMHVFGTKFQQKVTGFYKKKDPSS